jgi:NADH:ubiquinone oxidoreductase subunit
MALKSNCYRHAWMSYMVDKPPSEDKIMQRNQRVWEPERHVPNSTASKSAFKTYSTYVDTS